ncbi:MAG: GH92 family glycosyl hydrolase, partial [Crocinitomicaceae bacterium]
MKKVLYSIFFFNVISISAQLPQLQQASDQAEKKLGHTTSRNEKIYPTSRVNPFIGTGGHGHTFPGATAPFGMIQLSPDTRHDGWDGCSGYHYSDSIIYGFSHTHLSGTGVPDYCDLLVLPTTKKGQKLPGYLSKKGFGAKFKHSNESAKPGLYSVLLQEENIQVRLVAGKRAAIHEYSFPENNKPKIVILDLEHRDKLLKGEVFVDTKNKNLIEGSRISSSWASEQHFYFSMILSSPYQKIKKLKGQRYAVYFPKNTKKLYLFVGISAVDKEGARKNLESENNAEAKDFISKFTSILTKTMLSWDKELSGIAINSSNNDFVTNFYTALYHSYTAPNLFSDADGKYRGRDNKVHQLENDDQYTVFSLWDTYRANHPLFTITQQQKTNAFIRTFLRQYDESGDLPVWELAGNETECMIGYHAVSVIA